MHGRSRTTLLLFVIIGLSTEFALEHAPSTFGYPPFPGNALTIVNSDSPNMFSEAQFNEDAFEVLNPTRGVPESALAIEPQPDFSQPVDQFNFNLKLTIIICT